MGLTSAGSAVLSVCSCTDGGGCSPPLTLVWMEDNPVRRGRLCAAGDDQLVNMRLVGGVNTALPGNIRVTTDGTLCIFNPDIEFK